MWKGPKVGGSKVYLQNKESPVWVETSRPSCILSAVALRVANTSRLLGSFSLTSTGLCFFSALSFLTSNNGIIVLTFEIYILFYHSASAKE